MKLLYPPTVKCRPFRFLPVIVKNSFYLTVTFQIHKYQLFVFLIVHNMRKRQQSSGKFRLHKYLFYDKQPVEHGILSFSVFSFLQH